MSEGKLNKITEGSIGVTIYEERKPDNTHKIVIEIDCNEVVMALNKWQFIHFAGDSTQIRIIAIENVQLVVRQERDKVIRTIPSKRIQQRAESMNYVTNPQRNHLPMSSFQDRNKRRSHVC